MRGAVKRTELPENAFIDPFGRNEEKIENLLSEALVSVLSYASTAATRPPMPLEPFSIPKMLFPEEAVPSKELLLQLERLLQGAMNEANPRYLGHMDPPPTTMSVVGEFAAGVLNNNMLSVELSPVFSQLEAVLVREFSRLFGLGENAGGFLISGGSLANLQALAVARNQAFPEVREKGFSELSLRPVLFASEDAHTSIQKAAMILGLGSRAVIPVKTNVHSQMDVADLERQIEASKARNEVPFCVVATAGTTVTGSIDPLQQIAKVTREHHLWLHVDAAYGGALILSEQQKEKLLGIEEADSIAFNPQKWLYVTKACAMILFREFEKSADAFQTELPYMQHNGDLRNLGEISVQGTRHVDVLKLWLSLQHIGKKGYAQLVEEGCRLANLFAQKVIERPYLELADMPETNIVCFRVKNELNTKELHSFLLRESCFFLSLPSYRESRWLRVVLLNPYTDEKIVDELFHIIDRYCTKTNFPKPPSARAILAS